MYFDRKNYNNDNEFKILFLLEAEIDDVDMHYKFRVHAFFNLKIGLDFLCSQPISLHILAN